VGRRQIPRQEKTPGCIEPKCHRFTIVAWAQREGTFSMGSTSTGDHTHAAQSRMGSCCEEFNTFIKEKVRGLIGGVVNDA